MKHNSEKTTNTKILVIAPHTDDAELGVGASISRWTDEGHEVWVLNLSDTSNLIGEDAGSRMRSETRAASLELGVEKEHILFGDFDTRHFDRDRQRLLDFLIQARNSVMPQLVIGPSATDIHQDHYVVAREIARAFGGRASVLGYDTYWNMNYQDSTLVVQVSEEHVNAKIKALSKFESQSERSYMRDENIRAQARVRGLPRGYEFGEAFSVVEISLGLDLQPGWLP